MAASNFIYTDECKFDLVPFQLGKYEADTVVESEQRYSFTKYKWDSEYARNLVEDQVQNLNHVCPSPTRIHPRVNIMLAHTGISVYSKNNTCYIKYPYIAADVTFPNIVNHSHRLEAYSSPDIAVTAALRLAVCRGYSLVQFTEKELYPSVRAIYDTLLAYKEKVNMDNWEDLDREGCHDFIELNIVYNRKTTDFGIQHSDKRYLGTTYPYSTLAMIGKDTDCYQLARQVVASMKKGV